MKTNSPLPYPVEVYWSDTKPEISETFEQATPEKPFWSGQMPVPEIGQHVTSRANFFFGFLKDGVVKGYASVDNYLGVVVWCLQYTDEGVVWPEHRVKNGEINRHLLMYGAEIGEVFEPVQSDTTTPATAG